MQKMRNFFFVLWQMFLSTVLRRPQLDELPRLQQEILAMLVSLKGVRYTLLMSVIPTATESRINNLIKAGLVEKLAGFLLPTERGVFLISRASLVHPDNPTHFGFECTSPMYKYGYTAGEGANQYPAWPMPNNQFIRIADLLPKVESNQKAFDVVSSILNPTAPITIHGLVLEDRYRAAEIHHYVKFNEPVTFHVNDLVPGVAGAHVRLVHWDNVKAFSPLGGEFVYANIHLELVIQKGLLKVVAKLCHNYGAPVLGVLMQFNYMVNPLLEASAELVGPKPTEPDADDEPSDILKVGGLAVHSNIVLSVKEREVMDILYQAVSTGLYLGRCAGLDKDFSEGMVNWLVEIGAATISPDRVLRITGYGIELLKVPTSSPDNGAGMSAPAAPVKDSNDDLRDLLKRAIKVSTDQSSNFDTAVVSPNEAPLNDALKSVTGTANKLTPDEAAALGALTGFYGCDIGMIDRGGPLTAAVVKRLDNSGAIEFITDHSFGITEYGKNILTNYRLSTGVVSKDISPAVAADVIKHIESVFPLFDLSLEEFYVLNTLNLEERISVELLDASVNQLNISTIWALEKCDAIDKDEDGTILLTPYGKRLRDAYVDAMIINREEYNLLLDIAKSDKYLADDGVDEDDKSGFRENQLVRLSKIGAIRIVAGICIITAVGKELIEANVDNDFSPWGAKNV